MARDHLDYPGLVENALLSVVREALRVAAEEGLPGEHHFYLTFGTVEDGVEIPAFLRHRYPEEMTIILQHQFWDLEVGEAGFAVTLSFDRARHRMSIPFAALRAFADPAVGFGLRFGSEETPEPAPDEEDDGGADSPSTGGGKVVSLDRFRKKS